jgi:transcriptional regulator with XRE-family HTH domain
MLYAILRKAGGLDMAKIKVRPHPGALAQLLKRKGMTQMDAKDATGLDRKTLAKINRGGEVKLETIQQLAKKLHVSVAHFSPPSTASTADQIDTHELPVWMVSLLLHKVDGDRLPGMLQDSVRIQWKLNLQTVDEKLRELLMKLEEAMGQLHNHLRIEPHEIDEDEMHSLTFQLDRLKKAEDVSILLERLAEHHLCVLGADYLYWEKTISRQEDPYTGDSLGDIITYKCSRMTLLSVEPYGVPSRRVPVSRGYEPPKFAPEGSLPIYVNGTLLETQSGQLPKGVEPFIVPF